MIENENYITLGKHAQQHFEANLTKKQNYLQLISVCFFSQIFQIFKIWKI